MLPLGMQVIVKETGDRRIILAKRGNFYAVENTIGRSNSWKLRMAINDHLAETVSDIDTYDPTTKCMWIDKNNVIPLTILKRVNK